MVLACPGALRQSNRAAAAQESLEIWDGPYLRDRAGQLEVVGSPRHRVGDEESPLPGYDLMSRPSSGLPGETVTARAGAVRVEVADRSGTGVPQLRTASKDAEDGRGLGLVERLAARWGWRQRGGQTVTWFELRHG